MTQPKLLLPKFEKDQFQTMRKEFVKRGLENRQNPITHQVEVDYKLKYKKREVCDKYDTWCIT